MDVDSADVSSGVSVRFRLAAAKAAVDEMKDIDAFFLSVDCGEVEGPAWGFWRECGECEWRGQHIHGKHTESSGLGATA